MEQTSSDWRRDRWLWGALLAGLVIRAIPMILWDQGDCVRDECIYRTVAEHLLAGEGMTTTNKGWLPAPGYPALLAVSKATFGVFYPIKFLQVAVSLLSAVGMYLIGKRVDGDRTARVAAWGFALHPTLAFFTYSLWIETVYIAMLVFASLWVLWAREGGPHRALAPGLTLGLATLFRGVATYLPPIFALALLWPDHGRLSLDGLGQAVRQRWKHLLALGLGWAVMVAPYSLYQSPKQGGFMITDATVGHVMFLGNNDFPPLTFDYGNGMLTAPLYARYLRTGREPCDRNAPPVISSRCEVQATREWILANPGEFVSRIPMRVAQMVNPNSFFTRHLRWGYWSGTPWWAKELLVAYTLVTGAAIILGGTIGAWARARGPYGVVAVGTVLYTFATIALMYGMTRFRLPLEPLWLVYLSMLFSDPRSVWRDLAASPVRAAGALVTVPVLFMLMLWYLPTAYPVFW